MPAAHAADVIIAKSLASDQRLTVLLWGVEVLEALLASGGDLSHIEEVVLCSSDGPAESACPPIAVSSWRCPCKRPAQLAALRRAILKGERPRVAVVYASPPATASVALRCVQLYSSLPQSCLLILAPETPSREAGTFGGSNKVVLCAGRERRTLHQLGGDRVARAAAWRSFLLAGAGASASEAAEAPAGLVVASRSPEGAEAAGGEAAAGGGEAAEGESCLFPPVVLSVVDQLAELRRAADRLVVGGGEAGAQFPLRGGWSGRLVPSCASRYQGGGYAAHHYVAEPPSEHSACFELRLEEGEGEVQWEGGGGAAGGARVGYIALLPYGSSEPSLQFPTAVAWRTLHAAQEGREVALPPRPWTRPTTRPRRVHRWSGWWCCRLAAAEG